ncbi:MAG: DUF4261 domain-containing protein, partial [Rhizobiaceae bacterium]|nr:DUF4261 domain-containing protein [Rhizobiaceae bacterium]
LKWKICPDSWRETVGSIERFAEAMKTSGALGIFALCSGAAFTWQNWEASFDIPDYFGIYHGLVLHVNDTDRISSFGMLHFGLADTEIFTSPEDGAEAETLRVFNEYNLFEDPKLKSGHTFSTAEDAPVWELSWEEDSRYDHDHWYFNPNGVWQLRPVTKR